MNMFRVCTLMLEYMLQIQLHNQHHISNTVTILKLKVVYNITMRLLLNTYCGCCRNVERDQSRPDIQNFNLIQNSFGQPCMYTPALCN